MFLKIKNAKDINDEVLPLFLLKLTSVVNDFGSELSKILTESVLDLGENKKNIVENLLGSDKLNARLMSPTTDIINFTTLDFAEMIAIDALTGESQGVCDYANSLIEKSIDSMKNPLILVSIEGEQVVTTTKALIGDFFANVDNLNDFDVFDYDSVAFLNRFGKKVIEVILEKEKIEMHNVQETLNAINARHVKKLTSIFIGCEPIHCGRDKVVLLNYKGDFALTLNGKVLETAKDGNTDTNSPSLLMKKGKSLASEKEVPYQVVELPQVINKEVTYSSMTDLAERMGYFNKEHILFDLLVNKREANILINESIVIDGGIVNDSEKPVTLDDKELMVFFSGITEISEYKLTFKEICSAVVFGDGTWVVSRESGTVVINFS